MSFDAAARNRVHDWLFGQALPLWATAGIDDQDRFFEKLDFDGRPVTGVPRRTRVQARQTYVEIDGVVQPAPAPRFSRSVPETPAPPRPAETQDAADALNGWLDRERVEALRGAGVLP